MDIDFDASSRRFARDQGNRMKQLQTKRQQQQAERERTRAQQARWAADAAARREAAEAKAAEEARQHEEDIERNRGVAFSSTLKPVLSRAAEARGIVRSTDKVSLPRSAQAPLEGASRNGQLFFELRTPSGRSTHASILDFSVEEGTIGAPPQVLHLLGASAAAQGGMTEAVQVRYKVLKKGLFARVQPLRNEFQVGVVDVKSLLERELQLRTTLTEGDEVLARDGERVHTLRVLELQPESAVSLIDTDLEVEIMPSVEMVEAERQIAQERAREEQRRAEAEAAVEMARREQVAQAEAAARQEAAAAAAAEEALAAAAVAALSARSARRNLAAAALSDEPSSKIGDAISVVIRCPDGSRCARRFLTSQPLEDLFLFVEAEWREAEGAALLPEMFHLAASFPRRLIARPRGSGADPTTTLAAAGVTSKQEAFFVEIPVE